MPANMPLIDRVLSSLSSSSGVVSNLKSYVQSCKDMSLQEFIRGLMLDEKRRHEAVSKRLKDKKQKKNIRVKSKFASGLAKKSKKSSAKKAGATTKKSIVAKTTKKTKVKNKDTSKKTNKNPFAAFFSDKIKVQKVSNAKSSAASKKTAFLFTSVSIASTLAKGLHEQKQSISKNISSGK